LILKASKAQNVDLTCHLHRLGGEGMGLERLIFEEIFRNCGLDRIFNLTQQKVTRDNNRRKLKNLKFYSDLKE
jgi:hypothetical protein